MNLNVYKILATTASLCAFNMAHATAPSLTEFSPGTPAKAEEVNGNFETLKEYTAGLEAAVETQAALIAAFEASITALEEKTDNLEIDNATLNQAITDFQNTAPIPEFNTPVMGDGLVIGLTNYIPSIQVGGKMFLKTDYGVLRLKGNYSGGYRIANYNEHNDDSDDQYESYSDSQCTNPIFALSSGDGSPLIFTKTAGITDNDQIIIGSTNAWVIEAGTAFSKDSTPYFSKNDDNCDTVIPQPGGTVKIPMVELNTADHNLKHTYTSLSVDGYQLN